VKGTVEEVIDTERVLCRLGELTADGCREFKLGQGDWPLRGFVVRVSDGVRAYVNRCAHLDYPLNYLPHQFLSHDHRMIQCYVHGALFEKGTGLCVAGPCAGLSLCTLPVRIVGDYVLLGDDADIAVLAERFA
jgi:nitrite reductase/ring-hydroxylating ferredoxin subunit